MCHRNQWTYACRQLRLPHSNNTTQASNSGGTFATQETLTLFLSLYCTALEFLTTQFNKGASFSILHSLLGAIGQIADPDLGQDFRLKRFFKGMFGKRPPLPRYENTWDSHIV